MKPLEILSALEPWRSMGADAVVDSPAWAVPCRLGDETVAMRRAAVRPSDTLRLSVRFGDEPHALSLAPSPRFPELSRLWSVRGEVPEPVLLALVERECAPLFQMLENAVRKQFAVDGLGGEPAESDLCAEAGDVVFALTRSPTVVAALGLPRNLDLAHPSVRDALCPAECEYAAFALDPAAAAALAPGDAVVAPELETAAPALVVGGRIVLSGGETLPLPEDALCHVRAAAETEVRLGEVFDGSAAVPPAATPLRLVVAGKTVASCRLGRLASQPALFVE